MVTFVDSELCISLVTQANLYVASVVGVYNSTSYMNIVLQYQATA